MVYGPVTASQNIKDGKFQTTLLEGKDVVIQLIEPAIANERSRLNISRVVHGYRNTFPTANGEVMLLDCHNNVCNYPAWSNESDAVARILINGTTLCSGALLNNTSQDFKPYFLSAFHCFDRDTNCVLSPAEKELASNCTFDFRYKTCANTVSYYGSDFIAAWLDTDFLLLKLKQTIFDDNLTFSGWDRTSNASSTGTSIHHPQGVQMKISFDNDPLISNSSLIEWAGCYSPLLVNTHWKAIFDNGAIEKGSSGAPLFNTDKHVIGQFHGGVFICPPETVYFGRFDKSWTGGGTNDTRLSNWLDSTGIGATTINTIRFGITGSSLVPCSGTATFSLPTAAGYYSVIWSVDPGFEIVSGQGTETITVRMLPTTIGPTGTTIYAAVTSSGVTRTLTKLVDVGAPRVTSVTGPSTAIVGNYTTFYAAPNFPESQGDYEWVVSPNTASKSIYRHMCDVTFNQSGEYIVSARSTNSCISPGSYVMTTVSAGSSYVVSYGADKQLTVSLSGLDGSATAIVDATQMIGYTLYNQSTGALVTSGRISAQGGTLDFSSVPDGIYLFKLETGNNAFDTHRLLFK
jgi:hypothetical protein